MPSERGQHNVLQAYRLHPTERAQEMAIRPRAFQVRITHRNGRVAHKPGHATPRVGCQVLA
jgi:hypothetical protein